MKIIRFLVLMLVPLVSACGDTDEGAMEDTVEQLADALNSGSIDQVNVLYQGELDPLTIEGDSSAIYRFFNTDGASDFAVENLETVAIDDQGMATFDLYGNVARAGGDEGTMRVRLRIEMVKTPDGWRFLPGEESEQPLGTQ